MKKNYIKASLTGLLLIAGIIVNSQHFLQEKESHSEDSKKVDTIRKNPEKYKEQGGNLEDNFINQPPKKQKQITSNKDFTIHHNLSTHSSESMEERIREKASKKEEYRFYKDAFVEKNFDEYQSKAYPTNGEKRLTPQERNELFNQ